MADLQDYSLYDNDGKVYVVKVDAATARSLTYDNTKSYRMLELAKKQEALNARVSAAAAPKMSSVQGLGATPTEWGPKRTHTFLDKCVPHRATLRQKKVTIAFWNSLSGLLLDKTYTGEQLRKKMKALKDTFKNMKKKGYNSNQWEFYDKMKHLFDAPLNDVGCTSLPNQLEVTNEAGDQNVDEVMSASNATNSDFLSLMFDETGFFNEVIFVDTVENDPLNANGNASLDVIAKADSHPLPGNVAGHDVLSLVIDETDFFTDKEMDVIPIQNATKSNLVNTSGAASLNVISMADSHPLLGNVAQPSGDVLSVMNEETGANLLADTGTAFLNEQLAEVSRLSETNFAGNVGADHQSTPKDREGDILRSPTKKRSSVPHGSGRMTPKSTPSRKKRYGVLWPANTIHAFLQECILKKPSILSERVENHVWHGISDALTAAGHSRCEWQVCREKFMTLNNYFPTMLKTKGMMYGKKWSHYEEMCKLHDIPKNYEWVDAGQDECATPSNPGSRMQWDDASTDLLVSLFKQKRPDFINTKSPVRHLTLWNEIASIMQTFLLRPVPVTHKQCKDKIDDMMMYFRSEFDREKGTGETASEWPWFAVFLEMEEGRANLIAPFVNSVGKVTDYSVQGKKVESAIASRGSRARTQTVVSDKGDPDDPSDVTTAEPSGGVKPKPKKNEKKPLYRNRVQELQEAKLQTEREMVAEVRLLREQQGDQGKDRTEALKDIARSLRMLCPPKE